MIEVGNCPECDRTDSLPARRCASCDDRLRTRLERAEKILRDWQGFTQDTERMSTADAIEAGAPDYYQDMIAERDAFLRGD